MSTEHVKEKLPSSGDTSLGETWSVSLFTGPSPLALKPRDDDDNAVLRPGSLETEDGPVSLAADPFLVHTQGRWYLFFEIKHGPGRPGQIALAVSEDSTRWRFEGTVLRESFHLSYPHVFSWRGVHYMTPETLGAKAVRLYRANPFPNRWVPEATLARGELADPTPFRYQNRWWLFACPRPHGHDALCLFHSDRLSGPWLPHPRNPLIENDASRARPGGRVTRLGKRLVRFAQDCLPEYGTQVRAFEILTLSTTEYREREVPESPVLGPSARGWNARGMHHLDPYRLEDGSWLAAVDGRGWVPAGKTK